MTLAHGSAAAHAPPLLLALVAAAVLAAATWAAGRAGLRAERAQPAVRLLAGAFLLTAGALGAAPAAVRAGAHTGLPRPALALLLAAGLLATLAAVRRSCCGAGAGAGLAALAAHRLLEGAALGAGLLGGLRTGLVVLLALVVHGALEGVALTSWLRALPGAGTAARRHLAVLAAAPLAGVLLLRLGPLPAAVPPVVLALLSGVLLAMGLVVLRQPHDRSGAAVLLDAAR